MKIMPGIFEAILSGIFVFSILSYKPLLFGILATLIVFIIIKLNEKIGLIIIINLLILFIFILIVSGFISAFSLNMILIILLFILGVLIFISAHIFKKFPLLFPLLFFIIVLVFFNYLYFKEVKKFEKFQEKPLPADITIADMSGCEIERIYSSTVRYFEEIKDNKKMKKGEMDWENLYQILLFCLKKLEGEGNLTFDQEEIEKNFEKGNFLSFIKSFRASLVLLNYLTEKGELERAEEIIKKQAKILNRFLSAPQRSTMDWIVLNATLDIYLYSEILYSSKAGRIPEDLLKIDMKKFMEFSRKTFVNDNFNLLKNMEKHYAEGRKNLIAKILFEKIIRFSILNFYNTLMDEKNFQDWEFARYNLKERIYYGVMARIHLPSTRNILERIWITSSLLNIRDAWFYYLKNEKIPENFEDPFTKKPLKFIKEKDFILIYSLGPDLKDQKGEPLYKFGVFNPKIKQDIGYKIKL